MATAPPCKLPKLLHTAGATKKVADAFKLEEKEEGEEKGEEGSWTTRKFCRFRRRFMSTAERRGRDGGRDG